MKKSPLFSLIFTLMTCALCRTAMAADPAPPMADLEPQLTAQPAGSVNPGSPGGMGLDDFGFGHQAAQQPAGPAGAAGRDDEYRSAPQPMPLLEGF